MVTLVKTGNSVQVTFSSGEVYYLQPDTTLFTRPNEGRIYINNDVSNPTGHFRFLPTDINGRPNDDLEDVAEFLRDTYFTGLDITGGGSWPGDYATSGNQTTQIAELNAIEADVEGLAAKSAAGIITEEHDYKEIVYSGSDIDYISFKTGGSGGTLVATLTFAYNGNGDITSITKT
jgi:hypothetical protein